MGQKAKADFAAASLPGVSPPKSACISQQSKGNGMVRMATSFIVWVGVASVSWAGPGDPRDIANGVTIYAHGYCDQPYVAVAEDGTWICVFTTSPKHEGFQSQYIACTTSQDQG